MLTGKVALVTGAGRGIGREIALTLAGYGADVIVNYNGSKEKAEAVAAEIEAIGRKAAAVQCSVADYEACGKMITDMLAAFGHIDILVNNAGISHIGLLQDMDNDQWNTLIGTNLSSVFYCCKLAVPGMVSRKSGKILNISSVWGEVGASCEAAYSASKGGVNALTKALAKELAPSGIQVNAIACGCIDTRMNACFSPQERAQLEQEIPAGRYGTPEETAELAWMLLSGNDYLTGQIIRFDGGWI